MAGWARSWPDGLIKPDVGDGAVISVCMVMLLDLLWGPGGVETDYWFCHFDSPDTISGVCGGFKPLPVV